MKLEEILKVDVRAEDGAWIDRLPHLPDVKVKVRADGNSEAEKLAMELWGKADNRDDPATADAIEIRVLRDVILLDWEGIDDVPYSKENAEKMLGIRIFRQDVRFASRIVASRGREALEADVKNS